MRNCGCPDEYHLSDCPVLCGTGNGPYTKAEWLDIMMRDDYHDDHPPEGHE
jgi:hypothetical protein